TESGEALFTDYGLSGVAAMQCARAAGMACAQKKRVTLVLSLLPDWHAADVRRMMESRAVYWANAPMDRFFTGLLHKRIGLCLMQPLGISPTQTAASLTREQLLALSERLQAWHLPVLGTQDLTQAQVTAGGADVSAFDPQTLEATACPGLYATGELLDIDGDCGGYNLLWAWIAGQNAASNPLEGNIT
ncbi:MAG: NAD(P)/FAD-dependent oxidoreductase, partial [Clostridia bacterium]